MLMNIHVGIWLKNITFLRFRYLYIMRNSALFGWIFVSFPWFWLKLMSGLPWKYENCFIGNEGGKLRSLMFCLSFVKCNVKCVRCMHHLCSAASDFCSEIDCFIAVVLWFLTDLFIYLLIMVEKLVKFKDSC